MGKNGNPDIDVLRAVRALDEELIAMGESFTVYTCGGTSLIFLGYSGRKTEDIDVIQVEIEAELRVAADRAGKKLGYPSGWFNNDVAELGGRLAKGWKRKCTVLFAGEGVTLMSISRQDLINSKLHAAVNRQAQDMDDLIFLRPDLVEIDAAAEYALEHGLAQGIETYGIFLNYYVKSLKKDLGYE